MARLKPTHLRLVSPSAEEAIGGNESVASAKKEEWLQLDMFAETPQTVVFVAPEDCSFSELLKLLKSAHVRQIFDLREVPYLVFDGQTRSGFFTELSKLRVAYISRLEFETKCEGERQWVVTRELGNRLKSGPTMVFSDREPRFDPEVAEIDEDFRREIDEYKSLFYSGGSVEQP